MSFWFPLFIIFTCTFVYAEPSVRNSAVRVSQDVCINNAPEKNRKLIDSFNANKDPLKTAFLEIRKTSERFKAPACIEDPEKKQFGLLGEISQVILHPFDSHAPALELIQDTAADMQELSKTPYAPAALIKRECIAVAMQRQPGNDGYTCDYSMSRDIKRGFSPATKSVPRKYGTAGGKTLQCVNNDLVDYMHFSVNTAIQCLSPTNPIDSRVIFQKFNNETGFNHTLASKGGVGLVQTTNSAVKELTTPAGKGKYILQNVANSMKKSCEGFKNIAQQDLKKRPVINSNNYCSWVSSGDGLARSLLYGIGYYIVMRDNYVTPILKNRSLELATDKEIVGSLTAISYGYEGIKHSRWLMQKFRAGKSTNAASFLKNVQNNSRYLKDMKEKNHEVHCLKNGITSKECKNLNLSDEQLGGDECVSD